MCGNVLSCGIYLNLQSTKYLQKNMLHWTKVKKGISKYCKSLLGLVVCLFVRSYSPCPKYLINHSGRLFEPIYHILLARGSTTLCMSVGLSNTWVQRLMAWATSIRRCLKRRHQEDTFCCRETAGPWLPTAHPAIQYVPYNNKF